jgi:hypothetical protein
MEKNKEASRLDSIVSSNAPFDNTVLSALYCTRYPQICYITVLKVKPFINSIKLQCENATVFCVALGILKYHKRKRYWSQSAKNRRRRFPRQASIVAMLATIFATTKDPTIFQGYYDFEIESIMTVIDNYTIVTVLNDDSLFARQLKETSIIGIIIVSRIDYKLTHIRIAKILIKDDEGKIHSITIPYALYFLSSPVNVISIGRLSLGFRNGVGDDNTFIKLTCENDKMCACSTYIE